MPIISKKKTIANNDNFIINWSDTLVSDQFIMKLSKYRQTKYRQDLSCLYFVKPHCTNIILPSSVYRELCCVSTVLNLIHKNHTQSIVSRCL